MVWSMMVMHGLIMEMIQWGCFQLLIANYDAWSEILTDTEFMAKVLFFFLMVKKAELPTVRPVRYGCDSWWLMGIFSTKRQDMGRQMHLIFYRKIIFSLLVKN